MICRIKWILISLLMLATVAAFAAPTPIDYTKKRIAGAAHKTK